MLDFFSLQEDSLFDIKAQYQRLKNKSYMSIEHSQILACFLHHFITFFFRKVRSWSVRTGPENFGGPVRS